MKSTGFALMLATVLTLSVAGCLFDNGDDSSDSKQAPEKTVAERYFPLAEGAAWTYRTVSTSKGEGVSTISAAGRFTRDSLSYVLFATEGLTLGPAVHDSVLYRISKETVYGRLPGESAENVLYDFGAAADSVYSRYSQLTVEGTDNLTCRAAGADTVTVEAGTFPCMKFVTDVVQDHGDHQHVFSIAVWLAEDTGLVRRVRSGAGFSITDELTGYDAP